MRICHVITRMIVGGAQENTLFTLRGHVEHGLDTVLLTGPTDGPEGKLLQRQQVPGLTVEIIPDLVRQLHPLKDWRAYRQMLRYFRKEKFDVVHTHSSKAGILGRLAARKAGIPVVVHTVHGQAFHPYQSPIKNCIYIRAEKIAAAKSDRIYAVADAMIDQCVEAGVAKRELYQTVYSGMDLEPYLNMERDRKLAEALGIPDNVPVIGKIARLFELKGHEYLITAAQKVLQEVDDCRFLIVGDGLLKESLQARIKDAGMMDKFIFTGLVDPSEIPSYLSLMDILVHLSLREGLPRTVVQALASAKPAIGYALDGTPEVIINDETGYLCAPETTDSVADAIIKLVKDPELARKLGEQGRERVREKWDWHYMVDQLEADYARLLKLKNK